MEKVLVYGASGDQGVPLVNALIKLELHQDIQKNTKVKFREM